MNRSLTAGARHRRGTTPLLNLGCGSQLHPAWTNVDFNVSEPGVIAHDLRLPFPFQEGSFKVVYHSHVLEHLDRADVPPFLNECWRVLEPGGIIRVVVPDLERTCRTYLEKLNEARSGGGSLDDHRWMILELFDQFSRAKSGGEMLEFLRSTTLSNEDFVRSRIGDEIVDGVRSVHPVPEPIAGRIPPVRTKVRRKATNGFLRLRVAAARAGVRALLGGHGKAAFAEGLFRQGGEVHRWMYDRLSLARLLEKSGFDRVTVLDAFTSSIPDFNSFELDTAHGRTRKPDSMFVEAVKPSG